ncbi:MAG: MarR family winged helix-turn-helix transcriptional regulator [Saprospiraceae bacterium]|nr:MarR family winged helix-turn-helix transcriptional regulator [Saprospiraceae bacterium]
MSEAQSLEHLSSDLYSVALLLVRHSREQSASDDLTGPQRSVISRLVNKGPCTMGALADAEHVKAPTMTRIVQKLEAEGYIVKKVMESDRRNTVVDYTSKAWTALEKSRVNGSRALRNKLSVLSSKEHETLLDAIILLKKMLASEAE